MQVSDDIDAVILCYLCATFRFRHVVQTLDFILIWQLLQISYRIVEDHENIFGVENFIVFEGVEELLEVGLIKCGA